MILIVSQKGENKIQSSFLGRKVKMCLSLLYAFVITLIDGSQLVSILPLKDRFQINILKYLWSGELPTF